MQMASLRERRAILDAEPSILFRKYVFPIYDRGDREWQRRRLAPRATGWLTVA